MNHDWKLRYLLYCRIDKITKTVWMSVLVWQLILLKQKKTTYNIILKQELMSLQRLITNLIVTQNYGLLVRAAMQFRK
jgi:hypothetical protein